MIDAQKFAQPRRSRGGRIPIKITMSRETREQIGQIVHVGPGGQLSAFVDWACRLLLYTLGTSNDQEAPALAVMLEAITESDAAALTHTSSRLMILSLHLWAMTQELLGDPNYHITHEVIADMSKGGSPLWPQERKSQ